MILLVVDCGLCVLALDWIIPTFYYTRTKVKIETEPTEQGLVACIEYVFQTFSLV